MERARRLRDIWSWLPAFRVAAETEHLPTAAAMLHVSASSISRTVRLLEEELGEPLFVRAGRNMVLNRAGERMLQAVRDAMRIVDEGVTDINCETGRGTVDIAAPDQLAGVLLTDTLATLAATSELVARVHAATGDEADRLRRGQLDVALVEVIDAHDDISVEHLTDLSRSIYAGASHPLAGADRVSADDLGDASFVATAGDHWPIDRQRRVVVTAPTLGLAADLCASGSLLALLPDRWAERQPALVQLPVDLVAPSPLYLAYRRPVAHHARTERVLELLRQAHAAEPL